MNLNKIMKNENLMIVVYNILLFLVISLIPYFIFIITDTSIECFQHMFISSGTCAIISSSLAWYFSSKNIGTGGCVENE